MPDYRLTLRDFLIANDYPLDEGIRSIMAWSAHGSLRSWMMQWIPVSTVSQAVFQAGFLYDPNQDIIYSRKDAWQHGFGYCYGYDAFALFASFVFDCEPIFFWHKKKEWMIELWKGQYGIETGCEVGVYNRRDDDNPADLLFLDQTIGKRKGNDGQIDPYHSKFYKCVDQDEYLQIAFRLYRDGKELFSRGPEYHWWLTGFRWGVASRPEDLVLEVSIKFPDIEMRQAFTDSLLQMGYNSIYISDSTVHFTFDTPRSFQPRVDLGPLQDSVFAANEKSVSAYCGLGLPNNDPNRIEESIGDIVVKLMHSWLNRQNLYDNAVLYIEGLAKHIEGLAKQVAEDILNSVTDFLDSVKDFFGIK